MAQPAMALWKIRSSVKLRRLIGIAVLYGLSIALAAGFFFPFFFTITSSFKAPWEMYAFPPILIPHQLRWANYHETVTMVPFGRWFLNTLQIVFLATTGEVISASLVAFSFARFNYRFKETLFLITLSTMMFPAQVTLIPRFIMFFKLGRWTPVQFIDTLRPLWIPSWFGGGAFGIFLMRQFIQTIPLELDDAALIDGAGFPRIFATIIMPLCKPAIATLTIISFLRHWNAFIEPLIYINRQIKFPISVGVRYFQTVAEALGTDEPKEHLLMCASVLSTIVPITLFFAFQNVFVRGVVTTGIKG